VTDDTREQGLIRRRGRGWLLGRGKTFAKPPSCAGKSGLQKSPGLEMANEQTWIFRERVASHSPAPWEAGRWWDGVGQALPPTCSHLHPAPGKPTSIMANTHVCGRERGPLRCLWGAAPLEAGSSPRPWDGQHAGLAGQPSAGHWGCSSRRKEQQQAGNLS